jgi:hypothetical protein
MTKTKNHINSARTLSQEYLSNPFWRSAAIFVIGLIVGWFIFGWVLFPVRYTNVWPNELHPEAVNDYLLMTAEAYAATGDLRAAGKRLRYWEPEELAPMIDDLAESLNATNPTDAAYLQKLSHDLNLSAHHQEQNQPSNRGRNFGWLLALVLGLGVLAALIYLAERFGWIGRGEQPQPEEASPPPATAVQTQSEAPQEVLIPLVEGEVEDEEEGADADGIHQEPASVSAPPPPDDEEAAPLTDVATHILRFDGDPAFNTIVAIEHDDEYLGEYGLSAGQTAPANPNLVVSLDVWLFDKSDTQTTDVALVPPVVAADPDLQARYARETMPLLPLKEGQIILLQTAELRLEGRVRRVQYGAVTADGVPVIESAEIEMAGRQR